jgi:hypothetical protein
MDKLTTLLSFFAALSVATERITELVKGIPGLSKWFAVDQPRPLMEEFRKVSVQFVAILAGATVTYLVHEPLSRQLGVTDLPVYSYLVFGAMASGGSGIWLSGITGARASASCKVQPIPRARRSSVRTCAISSNCAAEIIFSCPA